MTPIRGLRIFSELAERTRRAIVRLVSVYGRSADLAERVRAELRRWEPRLEAAISDAQLMGYVRAAREVLTAPRVSSALARFETARPVFALRSIGRAEPSTPIFPALKQAFDKLAGLIPVTPGDFNRLDEDARRVAFTVARAQSLDAVKAVQKAIAEDVGQGGTLSQFRRKVAAALDGSAIGPSQVEALYRTHVGRAYSTGQIETLDNPAVRSAVPYLLYSATHDSRTRPEHWEMESHGLNGTAVYRADDPIWDLFYPPWAWNCRCIVIPIGVDEAADLGVKEAKEWKRTGRPPAVPQFVEFPPFRPPAGWVPTGRRLTPLV